MANIWHGIPRLGLNYRALQQKDALVNFGDRFFGSDRVSGIDKLELDVESNEGMDSNEGVGYYDSYVTSWIDATVKRKIQHLDVRTDPDDSNRYGPLYTSETLVSLKLDGVFLRDSEFISLPCLKTLHLLSMLNPNEATFERLFSSRPVLEELDIYGCLNHNVKVLRVLSKSLKKLSIQGHFSGSSLVIDAPRLGFLNIKANLFERFTITNTDTNVKLVIDPVLKMNLARYILENSAILKKLTLRLHKNDCSAKKYDLVKKLLKIPRGSAKCEVVFDWNREQVRLCDEFA
ncbi:hypothetical protein Bca52824_043687 [Brassica carinata]|uniref:FBD domain-containing protein n=1 Tax=Brassica carinata TaxID=52824 RepID=A0A8X7S0L2_BRACI|nr:hypothetical protein Bca52824_043687 [Brassica carinata]